MTLMRQYMGEVLRARRLDQGLSLRDVSARARVSLGYISEVERGHKEPSSELLAALAAAVELPLSKVLRDVGDRLAAEEAAELASVAKLRPARAEVSAA